MKISVITPVYDDYQMLATKLLPSIARQTIGKDKIEMIVVDDGTNVTGIEMPSWIKFVRMPFHKGANVSRNIGTMLATGDYYIYPDADCELYPYALKTMADYLDKNRNVHFVYGHFLMVDENGWVQKFQSLRYSPKVLLHRNYISVVTMFRKECYLGWNPRLNRFQDWEMWIRMMQKGYIGALIDDVFFFHFIRKKAISSYKSYDEARAEMLKELGIVEKKKHSEQETWDKIKAGEIPGVGIVSSGEFKTK